MNSLLDLSLKETRALDVIFRMIAIKEEYGGNNGLIVLVDVDGIVLKDHIDAVIRNRRRRRN